MTEPTERKSLRTILASIALATDLPVPTSIGVYDEGKVSLHWDTVAAGTAWAVYLGTHAEPYVHNGRRYLGGGHAEWHGWRIQLQASEPAEPTEPDDGLDEDTAAALAALAEQGADLGVSGTKK